MSVAIIINPISGGVSPGQARARAELASTIIDTHGDPAEVFVTERRGHARELARAALHHGARLVLAWGGDGTINEVASALAFQETPFGIVAAGSGNGLARELGVAKDPARAIADALRAEPRPMDLGEMNGRPFVNIAGIGFDAYVASAFDKRGSGRRGFAGYLGVGLRAIGSYVPLRYTITIGETRIESRAILVTVANSEQFGNGARIAPGARVDDGLLDLVVVEERSRWRTVAQLPRLFTGQADRIPGCSIRRIGRATIESPEPMVFHVDGEPMEGGTRIDVRVHPGALRVAVK
jgi:YegS/Rv2252/BmrU family lipid kinase